MSTVTPLTGLSHLDLSVSERHTSAQWYADVLRFEIRADRFNEHAQLPWVHSCTRAGSAHMNTSMPW